MGISTDESGRGEELRRIEDKLDALHARLDAFEGPVRGGVAAAGDVFDDLTERLPGGPAELDQRLRKLAALGLRVSQTDNLDRIEQGLDLLESFAGVAATAGDTFDALIDRGRRRGIEPEAIVSAIVGSDALRADNVELLALTLGELGNAADARAEPVGIIGLLRALREPEIQRTIGFLLHLTRRLGVVLDERQSPARAALGPGDQP